jgi:hypothetical protein
MNFEKIDNLLKEQEKLLSQLRENTTEILSVVKKVLSNTQKYPKNEIINHTKQILYSQQHLFDQLKTFSCPKINDIEQYDIEVPVKFLSGDILITKIKSTTPVYEFSNLFKSQNGYNMLIDFVYPMKFFYENKDGEQIFLYSNFNSKYDKMSWFERFGNEIPLVYLLIDEPTEEKRKNIVENIRTYARMGKLKVKESVDDDTLYSTYREWFIKGKSNAGETFFVRDNKNNKNIFDL